MSDNPATAIFSTNQVESIWGYANPFRLVMDLVRRRQLLWQFTLREVQGRYRGSYLGIIWALITPLAMLAVYTFVFHTVFKARWNAQDPDENFMTYAVNLFTGIIAYNVFSESVVRAPMLIIGNPNFVKKVVFPLEILPASLIGSALIHSLLSLVVLLVGAAAGAGALHWTLVFLPVVYLPMVLLTAGVCWLLSSLGVFLRDINNLVAVAVQLLFFMTPITYPMSRVPKAAQATLMFNPMAAIVDNFRKVVNEGHPPDWQSWLITMLVGTIIAVLGYAWFMKIKRAFADVI